MNKINDCFIESIELKNKIINLRLYFSIEKMGVTICENTQEGNKLMICGNIELAANAQRLALGRTLVEYIENCLIEKKFISIKS